MVTPDATTHKRVAGLELFRSCRGLHRLAHSAFEGIGLHRGQPHALVALGHHDGMTQSDLACALDVTPATISQMVRSLEDAGHIERRRDTHDERISRVYLTGEGRGALSRIEETLQHIEDAAFADFADEERAVTIDALRRVSGNLQRAADAAHGHGSPAHPTRGQGPGDGTASGGAPPDSDLQGRQT